MKKSIYKSKLYACGGKKYAAKLLSDYRIGLFVFTRELRSVDHHFGRNVKVFYQSKITGKRYKEKPKDYTPAKYREFSDASKKRKLILRRLNGYLNDIRTPEYLFSKKDSCYKKNALHHKGNTNFILMDISSFYPNTKFRYVKSFFAKESGLNMSKYNKKKEKIESDVADSFARLVTTPTGQNPNIRTVPQGFPTSTMISYFSYKEMFDRINDYAQKKGMTFSTYVDDLTFSYKNLDLDWHDIVENVTEILNEYGHNCKMEKTKYIDINDFSKSMAHFPTITGVSVKLYKVRASIKMHKKMNRLFCKVLSSRPRNAKEYIKKWKNFIGLVGMYQTINYIEPITAFKRENIKELIANHSNDFLFHVSIKRIEQLKWEQKIYDAYRSKSLKEFAKKHHNVIFEEQ